MNARTPGVTIAPAPAPRIVDPVKERARRILRARIRRYSDKHISDHEELIRVVNELRSMGCIIVFVTGVWDFFHIGHGDYLQNGKDQAASLYPADTDLILVVGYDTDALTRIRKGPRRPVVPEDERSRVLAHLQPVDIITPQREEHQLFNLLPHDVRIISESTKDLPNLELIKSRCEHVVNLPPQAETSTTARIRQLMMDGSIETLDRVSKKLMTAIEEARRDLGGQ